VDRQLELLQGTLDMLQATRYKFARRAVHHCDSLKPCVKSHPIINIVARLLSSEPWSNKPLPSLLARREPTTLSNQLVRLPDMFPEQLEAAN
jgi:hypothetical protein